MKELETLLIEIGTEELPPVQLNKTVDKWLDAFLNELKKLDISYGTAKAFAAPRRLALLIHDVPKQQNDRVIQKRGPALQAAFDKEGKPTKAALGFAKSNHVDIDQLEKLETDKGTWLIYNDHQKGLPLSDLVPLMLKESLKAFHSMKKMHWASFREEFLRPVHWVLVLHGKQPINFEILEVKTDHLTQGHRVHHPKAIKITDPNQYIEIMREAYVLADYHERQKSIKEGIMHKAQELGATSHIDEALLDLVTGLNEWPTPMVAHFDPSFLDVPQEALITAMQYHQKCFPLLDKQNKLLPKFVLVSNTDSKPNDKIVHGNERVMHARLSDAKFFYTQDLKTPLEKNLESLKNMIFQTKLGTLYDKTQRLMNLASLIANQIGANPDFSIRAAQLSKCDLMSNMVGEFPELQGIMGHYYALHDNEPPEVAQAIQEAYLPRFAGDKLPQSSTGLALSLADRLDTLVGIFGIGLTPTGDKDPFALRRSAIAIIRMILEKDINLNLEDLLKQACKGYGTKISDAMIPDILTFCFERAKVWFQDKGISPKVIEAVMALEQPTHPLDFAKRIEAVSYFQSLPEAESLAAANKRVRNILTKSGFVIDIHTHPSINKEQLIEKQEKTLYEHIEKLRNHTKPLIEKGDYTQTLSELAQLKQPVDEFFDAVLVNVEDEKLRQNRVNLLSNLHNLFGQVADISKL